MDVLDERPAADHTDSSEVEGETRREQEEEAERVRPVQRPLGAREAADIPSHCHEKNNLLSRARLRVAVRVADPGITVVTELLPVTGARGDELDPLTHFTFL